MSEPTPSPKPRRWRRWLVVMVGVILVAGIGIWFYAHQLAREKIENQLSGLGLGKPVVGSVTLGANGVSATDIVFFGDSEKDKPILKIDKLTVTHPISGLVAGEEIYNEIELSGVQVTVDVDAELAGAEFDIAGLSSPAKTLKVTKAEVRVRQADRRDLIVEEIDLTATSTGDQIELKGKLGRLADGVWTVDGRLDSQTKKWSAEIETASASIKEGTWQKWPLMPESLQSHIEADANWAAIVRINGGGDPEFPIAYRAEIDVDKSQLCLPVFGIPIEINSARLMVTDGSVRYEDVFATTDGRDRLTGSGSTTLNKFPVATSFKLDFEDLDVATLRKLAPAIPVEVEGRATGKVEGTVDVESTLRTSLTLKGRGRSDSGAYAQIDASQLDTTVELSPLIFDRELNVETLEGSVVIEARAKDLPADDIFATLDLESLGAQLQIKTSATGNFRLELPLATAEKLETWKMGVDAIGSRGSVGGQPVHNLRVRANLESGNLKFTQISAAADQELASKLKLTIDWPLVADANHSEFGELTINGNQVSPKWLIDFIEQQVANAGGDPQNSSPTILGTRGQLSGGINFDSRFVIPVKTPDEIKSWRVTGEVSRSSVTVDEYELRGLESSIGLTDGLLSIGDFKGDFEGGTLNGSGRLNILSGSVEAAEVVGKSVPLKWLAGLGAEVNPSLKRILSDAGLTGVDGDEPLDGLLTLGFRLKPNRPASGNGERPQQFAAEDTDRNESLNRWAVSTTVSAERLSVKGKRLSDLRMEGDFDTRNIKINKASFALPNGGRFDLSGSWQIDERAGQADLDWQRLPVGWLASLGLPDLESLSGTTSGRVQLSKTAAKVEGELPIALTGSISTDGMALAGFNTRKLGIDLRTEDGMLLLKNFRADDNFSRLNLDGSLKLAKPYRFEVMGQVSKLPISRVFALPSVTERIGDTKAVSGVASARVKLLGDLETFVWTSSGKVTVVAPRIDGRKLSDIDAEWSHVGSDWAASTGAMEVFGGRVELKELGRAPERIRIELTDLNAAELTSLAKLPIPIDGKLSGDASLNDWSFAETRWVELNLSGASAAVGSIEFGDLVGKANLKDRKLTYSLDGRLLNGKLSCKGEAELRKAWESEREGLSKVSFPLEVQLTNASLNDLYKRVPGLRSFRPLLGTLAAKADFVFKTDAPPTANGLVKLNDLTWNNERLTREVSTTVNLGNGKLVFDNLRADLKRGEISGSATIPLTGNLAGRYQLDIRRFDLQRFLEIVLADSVKGAGLLDARLSGRIGRTISGRGSLAINRAKLLGLSGRTFRVPVRFDFQPLQQSGRVEFRESKFQLFGGNISGHAALDFGRTIDLDSDLKISHLDTEALFSSLANFENSGQGDLSGRLVLRGKSIRSARDLKGSFSGQLDRVEALKLPLIDSLARFLGGNQIRSRDFDSDNIELRLNAGRVEVDRLNLSNSLAQIAISGNAFIDGRLDLDVSARVERINQPTLIEQLAGSPLSRLAGSPASVFAQTADFLSDRLVFVKIGGTVRRPQVRPDGGRQLQEETIRYFLRGTQILPIADRQNN